jgi:hypothetical protein
MHLAMATTMARCMLCAPLSWTLRTWACEGFASSATVKTEPTSHYARAQVQPRSDSKRMVVPRTRSQQCRSGADCAQPLTGLLSIGQWACCSLHNCVQQAHAHVPAYKLAFLPAAH